MQIDTATIQNKEDNKESACACGSGGCGSHSGGHNQSENDFNLPDRFQLLQEGDRVVEFGSGLGNDSISAARAVGPTGKVIGIDISEKNINTARGIADSLDLTNVEFRHGDITSAPVPDEWADIIYSTCVFNLQSDKQKVADEMYRVVKHTGYVVVSDFVVLSDIPDGLRKEAAELIGCIAGVEKADVFMDYFKKTGFTKGGIVEVNKVKLEDEILEKYLDSATIEKYNDLESDEGIFSVVLVVEKPETCTAETCCHNADKHKN
jgi:ubiquinone/menaquinone biosynthesis C-methylase UbiE